VHNKPVHHVAHYAPVTAPAVVHVKPYDCKWGVQNTAHGPEKVLVCQVPHAAHHAAAPHGCIWARHQTGYGFTRVIACKVPADAPVATKVVETAKPAAPAPVLAQPQVVEAPQQVVVATPAPPPVQTAEAPVVAAEQGGPVQQ
jgi:hypothetical protein